MSASSYFKELVLLMLRTTFNDDDKEDWRGRSKGTEELLVCSAEVLDLVQ